MLLGEAVGGIDLALQNGEELGDRLLAAEPAYWRQLPWDKRRDLGFYFHHLFGIEEQDRLAWAEQGSHSLASAFPSAAAHLAERLAEAREAIVVLERDLREEEGSLLARVEDARRALERRARLEALRQAVGRPVELTRYQVLAELGHPTEGRAWVDSLAPRWGIEPELLWDGLQGESEATGRALRTIERSRPEDVAGLRRALVRDIHSRERRLFRNLAYNAVDRIAQNGTAYPGMLITENPRRVNPHWLVPHVVGMVRKPTVEEVERRRDEEREYRWLTRLWRRTQGQEERFLELRDRLRIEVPRENESVGRSGIEAVSEARLRGKRGYVERNTGSDYTGRADLMTVAPLDGEDVVLSTDAELQASAELAFIGGYRSVSYLTVAQPEVRDALRRPRGAFVLIDLATGGIPVAVTMPSYTPTDMRRADGYLRLAEDPRRPLAQRSFRPLWTGSSAPYPGSTFKLVAALEMLESGIQPDRTYECFGEWGEMRCMGVHGAIDLHDAILKSCNVYFYRLGADLGADALYSRAESLGFGAPTGLQIAGESEGVLNFPVGQRAVQQFVIGQGHVVATPLQVARAFGGIATGRLVTPHFLASVGGESMAKEPKPLAAQPQHLEFLHRACRDVIAQPGGTAYGRGLARWGVCGKTGTAQVGDGLDHSWFAGWFPREAPRYAFAVFCENVGLHGGDLAAVVLQRFLADVGEQLRGEGQ